MAEMDGMNDNKPQAVFEITKKHLLFGLLAVLIVFGGLIFYLNFGQKIPNTQPSSTNVYPTSNNSTSTTAPSTNFTQNSIAYIGCSGTHDTVEGYSMIPGSNKLFWPPYQTGGKTIVNDWGAGPDAAIWRLFDKQKTTYGEPKAVWVQLCNPDTGNTTPYEAVQKEFDLLKQHVATRDFYVSPIYSFDPPDKCHLVNGQGELHLKELAQRAVSEGLAKAGPEIGPLTVPNSRNDCHANQQGKLEFGKQLAQFFDHL